MIRFNPKPTFKFKVELAQPGTDERASLTLVGRHMGQRQLRVLRDSAKEMDGDDGRFLVQFLDNWDGVTDDDDKPVKFSQENIAEFIDRWPGSAMVIFQKFCEELHAGRSKN